VAQAAGVDIVGAGSPVKGQSGLLAAGLGCAALDDLRSTLATADADLVWLASAGDFGAGGEQDDSRAVAAATGRNIKIASLEPIPQSALDLQSGGWLTGLPRPADSLRFLGLPRLSRSFREAAEALLAFGPPRMLIIDTWSLREEGSLAARLLGAIDLTLSLMGEPETIDAAFVGPMTGTGLHALPGETFQGLHGDLWAGLRFANGACASIGASNVAGRWNTTATLLSGQGRLRIYDDGFEWIGPDGTRHDQLRIRKEERGEPASASHSVAALADGLRRLLDDTVPDSGPVSMEAILTIGQAALLSARTAQPESPATIRRMMTR